MTREEENAGVQAILDRGLRNLWYIIADARQVREEPVAATALGEKIVVWRDNDGKVHAIEDYCPHRGAPLSMGEVRDGRVMCPYHGIQMNGDGTVHKVPAILDCPLEGRKAVKAYPVVEAQDAVFAYFGTEARPDPVPLVLPEEFTEAEWSGFLCTATWKCNYQYALDNLVDPMHGSYLHAKSFTLSEGAKQDKMALDEREHGFIVYREGQSGVNFDWTEFVDTGAHWVRLDIPYPLGDDENRTTRIVGFTTPIDDTSCQVYFWRLRKVTGWKRDMWRFLYRDRLEERHWHVLEQDRVVMEALPRHARDREMLYQHDIGVGFLRRIMRRTAREELLKGREAPKAAE